MVLLASELLYFCSIAVFLHLEYVGLVLSLHHIH